MADPADLERRLGTARSEWTRAVSLLSDVDLPEPRYAGESRLIQLCRQRVGENREMRDAITAFWCSAQAAGWNLGSKCTPEMAAEVYAALMRLRVFVAEHVDAKDPL